MRNLNPLPSFLFFTITITITSLALLTPLTLANSPRTTNNLVTITCKQTPDPALCQSALGSDPRSSKATDTQSLILIMVDVVKTRFSDSLRYVEDLTRKTHDRVTIKGLQQCIQLYRVVLDTSIDLAKRAVQQGDPKFGEAAMVDAGNEAEACRMGFPEDKVPGQITGRTQMLHGVSNVAASMIKTLDLKS